MDVVGVTERRDARMPSVLGLGREAAPRHPAQVIDILLSRSVRPDQILFLHH